MECWTQCPDGVPDAEMECPRWKNIALISCGGIELEAPTSSTAKILYFSIDGTLFIVKAGSSIRIYFSIAIQINRKGI
jgi:hypothetical protein